MDETRTEFDWHPCHPHEVQVAFVGPWIVHRWAPDFYCVYHCESTEESRIDTRLTLGLTGTAHRYCGLEPDEVRGCAAAESEAKVLETIHRIEEWGWARALGD